MDTNDISRKKYRLSLLYLVKGILKSALIGGVVGLVGVILLSILLCLDDPFSLITIDVIMAGILFGGICGIVYACYAGTKESGLNNVETGDGEVQLYNMFAHTYNFVLFSSAGLSGGAIFSIIGLFIGLLGIVYQFFVIVIVVPTSIIYLIFMAILETIFNGLPIGLGNFLDKLVPLLAKVAGMVGMVVFLLLINYGAI